MSTLFALFLILVIVFLIWFVVDYERTNGLYPKIFRDFREDIMWKMNRDSVMSEYNPKNIKTSGYEYDDKVKSAIRRLTKREKTFDRHESLGRLTEFRDATETAFVLGDLTGFNAYYRGGDGILGDTDPEALENATTFYNRVIRRLRKRPNAVNNPDFMLDRIAVFHEDHNIELPPDFFEVRVMNNNFDRVHYENDSQNVHDRNVSDTFANNYAHMREDTHADTTDNGEQKLREIRKSCRKIFSNSPDKYEKAKITIDKIIATKDHKVSKYDDNELGILLNVWDRINNPENTENAASMQTNLANALCDGSTVCAVGRVSRVLDSLTLLDSDSKIAAPPMTNQMLRDEIFTLTNRILNEELIILGKKESYEKGETLPEISGIKDEIRNAVYKQYDGNGPSRDNLDNIIRESLSAL
jgi:hypothetical protein